MPSVNWTDEEWTARRALWAKHDAWMKARALPPEYRGPCGCEECLDPRPTKPVWSWRKFWLSIGVPIVGGILLAAALLLSGCSVHNSLATQVADSKYPCFVQTRPTEHIVCLNGAKQSNPSRVAPVYRGPLPNGY